MGQYGRAMDWVLWIVVALAFVVLPVAAVVSVARFVEPT